MKQTVKVGVIGLGGRGYSLLTDVMLKMRDVEILAVCDLYEDRAQKGAEAVKKEKGNSPLCTLDYKKVIAMEEIDAIVITAAWEAHVEVALAAMRAGKYVGCEVGGAYTLRDCWRLVETFEETGTPCMMLENCCYGKTEMMVLNMVKQGLFGEVIHCAGGYHHDLREEISCGRENRHYRFRNYLSRNCENYPTHELGPIAKVLNINRGNRMISLTATASKAAGLHQYILDQRGANSDISNTVFQQGDIVTTCIRCAHGQTITLTLDTTLPRAYSRGFTVRGTKGMYQEDTDSIFLDGVHNEWEFKGKDLWGNAEEYHKKYEHPLWIDYQKGEVQAGHDGIDWLVFRAFFESVKAGAQPPIDVYDMAAWMSITPLSEQSIAQGGAVVSIPDFTNGKWFCREEELDGKYCLSKICQQPEMSIF